ncbi:MULTISPECIES: glycerol-3-phosphate responsive antiterminator [Clostridia]|uniref:glycerol-3-phosphate responsive antiterminator n=1 Tax=Clostridia TaxID=186801 RepID=UPI000F640585|nr:MULTISPECIES: glycerol-3-phosphate responsive antiterminator [Clostridia]MCB6610329.1 glycerol-3-phosphate responsive antiterminator [[Clostridium] symbiosum]MCB6932007.1 glycerol-3-phosphate responsive antiterminator [[Clostridium] symbiosum]
MRNAFNDILIDCPVIAAVKDDEGLKKCLESESQIVFILYGDLIRIPQMVKMIKDAGKLAMVHIDLVAGLSGKEVAVDFIKQETMADGIISTKMAIVKRAKELGLVTVFRFFVIDSMAFDNIRKQYHAVQPDVVEILPGLMPKIITKVSKLVSCPVIAGGLIADKADIIGAIEAGATAISSTNQKTWFI